MHGIHQRRRSLHELADDAQCLMVVTGSQKQAEMLASCQSGGLLEQPQALIQGNEFVGDQVVGS